jgi:hypothetical protein
MGHPVEITTPFPTVEEVARTMGVSPSRTQELVRLAHESLLRARDSRSKRAPVSKRRTTKRVRSRTRKS